MDKIDCGYHEPEGIIDQAKNGLMGLIFSWFIKQILALYIPKMYSLNEGGYLHVITPKFLKLVLTLKKSIFIQYLY